MNAQDVLFTVTIRFDFPDDVERQITKEWVGLVLGAAGVKRLTFAVEGNVLGIRVLEGPPRHVPAWRERPWSRSKS